MKKRRTVTNQHEQVTFGTTIILKYEGNGNRNKTLSIKEYLDKIKSYLKSIINNPKKSDAWKIQLTIAINFIFLKGKERVITFECIIQRVIT